MSQSDELMPGRASAPEDARVEAELVTARNTADALRSELSAGDPSDTWPQHEAFNHIFAPLVVHVERLSDLADVLLAERQQRISMNQALNDQNGDLMAEVQQLREALAVYADPRNWGISRDDFRHKVLSWIGPGSTAAGAPNGMEVARAALAVVRDPSQVQVGCAEPENSEGDFRSAAVRDPAPPPAMKED